jgi:hypothetical protein
MAVCRIRRRRGTAGWFDPDRGTSRAQLGFDLARLLAFHPHLAGFQSFHRLLGSAAEQGR